MDQLIIKDLELFGFHGVNPEEKEMGQKFIIDACIHVDLEKAGHSDHIDDAIHYGNLCHELQQVFNDITYNLIERGATVLIEHILFNYDAVTFVDLTLKKPWAPVHLPIKYPAVRLQRGWHIAYVAVGSNIGNREETIKKALSLINANPHTQLIKSSTLIETEPVGYIDQEPFLNGVIKLKTILSPARLMTDLLNIEKELKRERIIHWGPRTIDLDIIYYDDLIINTEHTVIPHPRMQERLFVLEPLAEIAPYKVHPLYHLRTLELIAAIKNGKL